MLSSVRSCKNFEVPKQLQNTTPHQSSEGFPPVEEVVRLTCVMVLKVNITIAYHWNRHCNLIWVLQFGCWFANKPVSWHWARHTISQSPNTWVLSYKRVEYFEGSSTYIATHPHQARHTNLIKVQPFRCWISGEWSILKVMVSTGKPPTFSIWPSIQIFTVSKHFGVELPLEWSTSFGDNLCNIQNFYPNWMNLNLNYLNCIIGKAS